MSISDVVAALARLAEAPGLLPGPGPGPGAVGDPDRHDDGAAGANGPAGPVARVPWWWRPGRPGGAGGGA
jgi:hypothetical protein